MNDKSDHFKPFTIIMEMIQINSNQKIDESSYKNSKNVKAPKRYNTIKKKDEKD